MVDHQRTTNGNIIDEVRGLGHRLDRLIEQVNHQNTRNAERITRIETNQERFLEILDDVENIVTIGNENRARIVKLETWRDLTFWAVGFGIALSGFILGALKFAGV